MKYLVIIILWAGYCALHSYLISISFTNLMDRLLKKYYAFYRLFYVLISLILLIPLINFTDQSESTVIITYVFPFSVIRNVIMWGALLLFFWAFFFDYDSLSFFGIRQILAFGKEKKTNQKTELKKKGLLGIIRHPMYFALIIFLWCGTFRVMDIVVNTVLTIYVLIGTLLEEKKLVAEFGEAYTEYKKEVPMLIPFTGRKVK
jgi:methanethiol S-methyltransferase